MLTDAKRHTPAFRWLHISDLHIVAEGKNNAFLGAVLKPNSSSHDQFEREGLKGIVGSYGDEDCRGVDCIIATGDFFHQGQFGKANAESVESVIETIYDVCREASRWSDDDGGNMSRFCFCPGNHDVRRAALMNVEDEDKELKRADAVLQTAKTPKPHLTASHQNRDLLVKESFSRFYSAMPPLKSRRDVEIFGDKQIVCFKPNVRNSDFRPKVILIGLNTALLAGQKKECPSIRDAHIHANNLFFDAQEKAYQRNYKEAKKDFLNALEELSLANEDTIDDFGKMCLPEEAAFKELKNYLSCERANTGNKLIPVLFGHHSLHFFNNNAQFTLKHFIEEQRISLYLCGHSHQLSDAPINTNQFSHGGGYYFLPVTMGGLFMDEDRFNHISFSIGTITWDDSTDRPTVVIDHYMITTSADNPNKFGVWMHGQSIWPPESATERIGDVSVTVAHSEEDNSKTKNTINREKNQEKPSGIEDRVEQTNGDATAEINSPEKIRYNKYSVNYRQNSKSERTD